MGEGNILEVIKAAPVAGFIFLVILATSLMAFQDDDIRSRFIFSPSRVYHGKKYTLLVSSGFIHADAFHLVFNLMAFYFMAFGLEQVMALYSFRSAGKEADTFHLVIGHVKFAVIYFGSLVFSKLPLLFKHKNNPMYFSLGASGAVSGLVGSLVLLVPMARIWGLPAWLFALIFMAISYIGARRRVDNIGHEAHLFGLLSGFALTFMLFPKQSWAGIQYIIG